MKATSRGPTRQAVSAHIGTFLAVARAAADVALEALAPRACAACDAPLERRAVFCGPCAATVELAPPNSGAVATYGGAVAEAIVRFKYGGRPDLGAQLGELLRRAPATSTRVDLVVPVPLHASRLVERGYNQAALLARSLARGGAHFAPGALERSRSTSQQTRLSRGARLVNMAGAFRASRAVAGARVLVVDDVVTTGATLAACREAAIEAGATSVALLALAAADRVADASSTWVDPGAPAG